MTLKNDLISLNPKIRKKGFEKNNYVSFKHNNLYVNEIKIILEKILKNNKDSEENKILNIILNSYNKTITEKNFDEKDFILTQNEIYEFQNLKEEDFKRYFIYRYKYKKYPQLFNLDEFPPCVQIEPTSICNLRCIMCYQSDNSFSKKSKGFMGHMSLDLFKKVIDELEGNVEAITLASRGEPTLNSKLIDMINYCGNKFLALKINTNATMLNEKLIHQLLSSGIQSIVLSIDEKNKENYEKIRVNAKFETIMKNLKLLNNIRRKDYKNCKKQIRISGVKINENQNAKDISDFYKEFADQITLVNYNPWQSAYDNDINDIVEPCGELYRRMFIWWDGKVNPCDYDYKSTLSKWNIKNNSVKEIWNSNEYSSLRQLHQKGKRKEIEPCKRCISI